jgi:predicted mannosyl-3-phosphoglycerate phosphatase (HAD superfamily)
MTAAVTPEQSSSRHRTIVHRAIAKVAVPNRLSHEEAQSIFQKLHDLGFKVVPAASK